MRVLVLVIVGGCGFSVTAGVAPDGGPNPDGAPFDGAAIDAPLVDDTDDDDDGILDVSDNCPLTANADQHDEDADLRGDRCDPCPQLANANTDGDGDKIGDACDPHPGTAGDVLVLFDGFPVDLSLPTGWTQIGGFNGDWGVSGDALRLDTQDMPHLLRYDAAAGHTTIDLLIDASLPGANVPSMTAIVDGDSALTTFSACSVLVNEQSRRVQTFASGAFTSHLATPGTVSVPGRHRIVATNEAASLLCNFPPGGGAATTLTSINRTNVGLRIRNLRVAIHYIAIYRSP